MAEEKLSAVLSEFARTLATDFPIQGILNHLVERIVGVLPVTSAGVTLITEGEPPRYIAASDANALRYEELQTEIGEGPCLLAYSSGEAVAVPALAGDPRFRRFGPRAVAVGLAAVFTFPLRYGSGCLGALDLYRETAGDLSQDDMAAAQTLADVTVAYLLNAQAREDAQSTTERFRLSALHDPLTGLPNRLLLQQRLEHAAQRAQRSHSYAAVLFTDLDHFKAVNDTHGHPTGDELLVAVALRLSHLVRPGDTLCRYAGDEFVFLCEDLNSVADAEVLATRVDEAFREPFALSALELSITASVGMAFAGPGETISDLLVVEADTAMYQAKRKGGGGHQIIDLREASLAKDRVELEGDLRGALRRGQLTLAYQPIVASVDGLVVGAEALLRWSHPLRGTIPALWTIGIAEQSTLITEIGEWVLTQACLDHRTWSRLHNGTWLDLSVNVSTRQLMSSGYCAGVARVLASTGMDPEALVLEVTEHIVIDDSERAMTVLSDLRSLGIRIALDDFGTGYSSLSYLESLPIDILKVDQSFIARIGTAATGREIVAAVATLAHALGLTVTAEGVETAGQRQAIAEIGCESAQGFFFAAPMTAEQLAMKVAGSPDGVVHLPAVDAVRAVPS